MAGWLVADEVLSWLVINNYYFITIGILGGVKWVGSSVSWCYIGCL